MKLTPSSISILDCLGDKVNNISYFEPIRKVSCVFVMNLSCQVTTDDMSEAKLAISRPEHNLVPSFVGHGSNNSIGTSFV